MVVTLKKIATCLVIPVMAATFAATTVAEAVTKRSANVVVQNRTGKDIVSLNLVHKYSDVYKSENTWKVLKNGANSSSMRVHYNTGFGTTGQDWWAVNWVHPSRNPRLYYSNPNNFRNVIDVLEQATAIAIPIATAAGVATAGALCAGKTGGACAPAALAATEVAGAAAGVFADLLLNSEGTSGFKKHFLESDDEGSTVVIRLERNNGISIFSKSGTSKTVYSTKNINLRADQLALIEANLGGGNPGGSNQVNGLTANSIISNGASYTNAGGGIWNEVSGGKQYRFREAGRDNRTIYLQDDSRGVRLELDLQRKEVRYSDRSGAKLVLYRITSAR